MKTIRVDRQALYEQVWSTPMSKLASHYKISDSGLAKICWRMGVPRPEQGHWVRKPERRDPRRPLPELKPGQPNHVMLQIRTEDDAPQGV